MHREISHANGHFEQESPLSLYLLTALVGLLIGADVWPYVARWVAEWGPSLPTWGNEVSGYRLALLAAVIGGARALYGSLDSLLQGRLGADLALAIAAIAAILLREPLVAAEIVFIGMVGECLESITFERTQRAVRSIVEICPRRCWRLRDGREERVFAADLQVGDLVVVKPGARIPADGIVREGRSSVDVSALTGESLPVERGPGQEVLAGSLNKLGALTIEAVRVAEHTVVGQVIELTSQALKNKATVERTADRLARYFLPAVLGLAALTFLGAMMLHNWFRAPDAPPLAWRDLVRLGAYPALSVLVVACPCALILATPAAVIAALGRLAGTGILIKGGVALERLAGVDSFAFDKTGTLTEGRLELGEVVPFGGADEDAVLRLAATAEQQSEHLLARLILNESTQRNFTLDPVVEFQAHPGAGVEARIDSSPGEVGAGTPSVVLVGNRRLMEERGVELPAEAEAALERLDAAGQTALLVASGRPGSMVLAGLIGVRDRVRPEAMDVVAQLRALGIGEVAMLTGDREAVARSVAEKLGISTVRAEVLPQEKAQFIADRQAEGRRVAMVGDGINDAPALARADVGLALGGTGTDVAAEAGDVVFMGDPLRNLPMLVRLARHTVHIIRQNIIWFAFVVNAVGVVVTAWLWPLITPATWYEESPLAAVIYHQLGSLAVLLNAMRLLWFERESPAAQRWKRRLEGVNAWMERWLNFDELLHTLAHNWRLVWRSLTVLALLAIALSGVTQVGPEEIGIVRRFGKPLPEDLGPGLHWTWPWPIDTVIKVAPDRVYSVEIGYRVVDSGPAAAEVRSWASSHQAEGRRRIPDEAVMLTGDHNLIELQGTLRYSLANPRVYLLDVREPEKVLRSATESVLRDIVASQTFAELLTSDRKAFQEHALAVLRERLREHHPEGFGVRLEALSLHDIHPPQEVVQAYYNVAAAIQKKQQRINQAEADALRRIADQYGRNLKLLNEARAERYEKERIAQARKEAFVHRAEARTSLSPVTEVGLFLDSLSDLNAGKTPEESAEAYLRRRADARARQALVTEFRLASEALAVAMGGREKMILDTDRLPSWFQLWLLLGDRAGLGGASQPYGRQPPLVPPRESAMPERSSLER